jgi:hypothetical protein
MTGDPSCALTVCRGCCCGTGDPEGAHDRLERLHRELPGVQITVSDCLGPCARRDVVVVRAPGSAAQWFGDIRSTAPLDALIRWVRAGGPHAGTAPDALRGRAFRPQAQRSARGGPVRPRRRTRRG